MPELITIADIALKMGVSYHVARNTLKRTTECDQYKTKLTHTVVYDAKVLEIVCKK